MVLVTGGAGLLGSELIRQLLSGGVDVRAIYNKTPLPDFNVETLQLFQCDILDVIGLEEAMQGIEQVYHCAAVVSFDPSRRQELFKINIEGTANIVNAALSTGIKKLMHVSSVAALGKPKEKGRINESINWTEETGNSVYAQSKYLSELEVWRGIGEGLDAVIVNPVTILGAGEWTNGSSQLFKSVYDGFPWYSDGITGFVDVRDVAKAMIALMESEISSERFIISEGNHSYRKIFNLIAGAFGRKPPSKKVTPLIAALVWRLEASKKLFTGKSPLVTRESARAALASTLFENDKLMQFLPEFQYRQIEETILDTCAAMQQKLNKV